jgi:hypothetical protein
VGRELQRYHYIMALSCKRIFYVGGCMSSFAFSTGFRRANLIQKTISTPKDIKSIS